MVPVESQFVDPDFSDTGTLRSCAEMIHGGMTTVVDGYDVEEEVARAACGQMVMRLPTFAAGSFDAGIERLHRFMAEWRGHPRMIATVAPHAPYTCTDDISCHASAICAEAWRAADHSLV